MQNTQLIRYITANFSSLRGLRRLPFGIYYLLGGVVDGWIIPHDSQTYNFFVAFSILFLVALALTVIINTYYTRTFGDVLAPAISPKDVVRFSRIWLWIPVVVGVFLTISLDTNQELPEAVHWIVFVSYAVLTVGSFALQWRKKNAYGPVPIWPIIVMIIFFAMVPGIIKSDNQYFGLNNFALRDWIMAVFLIGSGIYNHLQMTRGLQRVSEEIHGSTTI